jgi:hypothetical protein
MSRMHVTPGRVAAVSRQLSTRDLDIVATLSRTRLATTLQLQRLHFTEGSPESQARRCRRTLQRLVELDVLARLDRRIGGARAGSAGFIHGLGTVGQRLNGGHGPAGGERIRRPWTPSLPFVAHVLCVTEIYAQLREVERRHGIELIRFDAEPAAWRHFTGPAGNPITLKPDAYAVTSSGDWEDHRFIEVDRATESPVTIATKLRTYRQYWSSGREQYRHEVFPGVLIVVPDPKRQAVIVGECTRQPADAWHLFQVVVWSDAIKAMTSGGTS